MIGTIKEGAMVRAKPFHMPRIADIVAAARHLNFLAGATPFLGYDWDAELKEGTAQEMAGPSSGHNAWGVLPLGLVVLQTHQRVRTS